MNTTLAHARFFQTLGAAANQLAADLTHAAQQQGISPLAAAAPPESLVNGPRQKAIVALPELRHNDGLKTAAVAVAIGNKDVPNVQLTLRSLEKRGLVELVPGRTPQHWRLVERYRVQTGGV